MCLCHLPVSDVNQTIFGHRQGEGGQVASTEHVRDVGAHVLQEGDRGGELLINSAE